MMKPPFETTRTLIVSRSLTVDFILLSLFIFYFTFLFFSRSFSIFRTAQVRVYQSHCHISHKFNGVVTRLITRLGRRKQKRLEQSDVIQHGQHMLASCHTHGTLGQGAQQLARTMRYQYIRQITLSQEFYRVLLCYSKYKSCSTA